jgi:regulator of protease activity HflC (stomatin/prohibitin superfamily)
LELAVALITIAALAALVVVVRRTVVRVTIFEYERGLRYRNGRFGDVVPPGRYRLYRPSTRIVRVDMRPRFATIPGQEVLSADGVTLRVSLAARYEVADPVRAINDVEDYHDALYLTLQLGLRRIIGSVPIEEVLDKRHEIGARLVGDCRDAVAELGLTLLSADVKDVMFPGPLKKIFAQVVEARQEGLAALERARGETAALRNLANAASLVERNPALMHLRLLQQLAASTGNTLVLGLPGATTPLPLRAPDVEGPSPAELGSPEAPE